MNINEAYKFIKESLKNDFDVKYREIGCDKGTIYTIFSGSMCDSKYISEYIIAPLVRQKPMKENIEFVKKEVLYAASIDDIKTVDEAISHILSGDIVIIFPFFNKIIYCETKGFAKRGIEKPITEGAIKGPRESFNESVNDNIALIKRRVKDSKLKFENFTIGTETNTLVVMSYIEGVAPVKLVDYIRREIQNIKNQAVIVSNVIEEQLQCKHTVFDTIGFSEKPDAISSKICEGRIAIIVDGTPFVITVPFFFIEHFQTGDDYAFNKYFGNMARFLRIFCFGIATLLPGFYIAIVTHHFTLIPYSFVFRLAISRAGVPFPTVVEVLMMMLFFQISREAGVRLPQPIGQSMSIVGALILGDATVGAGIASQTTLIIVALASIGSFLIPKLYGVLWSWSVIIVIFSAVLGLPGFYIAFCIFISHMAALNSCGYPFLYPLGTLKTYKYKDILVRGDLNQISNDIFAGDEINEKGNN